MAAEVMHFDPTGWTDSAKEFLAQVIDRQIETSVIVIRTTDGDLQYRLFSDDGDTLKIVGLLQIAQQSIIESVIYDGDEYE